MSSLFKGVSAAQFDKRFKTDSDCLKFLASEKWRQGYYCAKCGNTNYCSGKSEFARRCTRCKYEESAMAHTPFHHCKMPLLQAFQIYFTICNSPDISSWELSRTFDVRQMTCWKFRKKILECLQQKQSK